MDILIACMQDEDDVGLGGAPLLKNVPGTCLEYARTMPEPQLCEFVHAWTMLEIHFVILLTPGTCKEHAWNMMGNNKTISVMPGINLGFMGQAGNMPGTCLEHSGKFRGLLDFLKTLCKVSVPSPGVCLEHGSHKLCAC